MPSQWIGTPVPRREDKRLLTGKGRFVDDLHLPGCLHAAVLRSPYAHARINSIDIQEAQELPGVITILTPETLGQLNRPFPLPVPHPKLRARTPTPLAAGKVRYAGEPVAVVVAANPRFLDGWARLGQLGRDDIERYAAFRVGYHRGLDRLRASGWRGSGYVRWQHETNRGFLRALHGLAVAAARIGEADEQERCELFLRQLDPSWPPADLD